MIHQHATNGQVRISKLITGISKHVEKVAVTAFWTLSLMIQPYKTQLLGLHIYLQYFLLVAHTDCSHRGTSVCLSVF